MNDMKKHNMFIHTLGIILIIGQFLLSKAVIGEDAEKEEDNAGVRTVRVAMSQTGRHDSDDGLAGLYHGHGSAWCSEFVSWCYMMAGTPFSGGRKNLDLCFKPWNLTNTRQIIKYFKKHHHYYKIDDLPEDLAPKPGDYVFVTDTEGKRAHSGIVKEVIMEENGTQTLVTIEGNNRGRPVGEYRYPDFRNTRVGEGVVGGIGAR